jgi:hypothetical protein
MAKKTNRPKWAKKLNSSEWQHLKEGQPDSKVPSLRQFRADREWQKKNGEPCLHCRCIETALEVR